MESYNKYGLIIEFVRDDDPQNPRENDNLGTMVCFHRRYNLGDKHKYDQEEAGSLAKSREYVSLPLYLYDHSGITMSVENFNDRWDSGQVGWILISKEKIRSEFNTKRITRKILAQVIARLKAEVEEYDAYLRGECYGYQVKDENGEIVDSCWGYLCGTQEARDYLKYEAEQSALYHAEKIAREMGKQFAIDSEPELAA